MTHMFKFVITENFYECAMPLLATGALLGCDLQNCYSRKILTFTKFKRYRIND
jgi:hypothetical protein